jgi:hypothetical protein
MTAQMVDDTRPALCPPDLLLQIDLPNVGVLSNRQNARIIEAGYEAARVRAEMARKRTELELAEAEAQARLNALRAGLEVLQLANEQRNAPHQQDAGKVERGH